MKKNIFIFAVSIISVLGVYSGARADIAAVDYVTEQLAKKLNADLGTTNKDNALITNDAGGVIAGKIDETHLAQGIKDKINNALTTISATTTIDDKAIAVAKLNGGANANKVLTVADETGTVLADYVKIPVGSATAPTDMAGIWIEN